jgi:prolyl-tRNA synthetase
LVRGDRTVNEQKLRRAVGSSTLRLLEAAEVQALTGAAAGFSGPVGLSKIRIIADREIPVMDNAVVGANADDFHLRNVNPGDFEISQVSDLRRVADGDQCPRCADGILRHRTGYCLGYLRLLSGEDAPEVVYDGENGQEVRANIGLLRLDLTALVLTLAAIHQDERGLRWPESIAPYRIHLLAVNPDDQRQTAIIDDLARALQAAKIDVLYDDRGNRIGGKFQDADLLGIPHRITVGPRGLKENLLDWECRRDGKITKLEIPQAATQLINNLQYK